MPGDPGDLCTPAGDALETSWVQATKFTCDEDGTSGMTFISFQTHYDRADTINQVLDQFFPMINGFNCPRKSLPTPFPSSA
jgi:hypothetical protein